MSITWKTKTNQPTNKGTKSAQSLLEDDTQPENGATHCKNQLSPPEEKKQPNSAELPPSPNEIPATEAEDPAKCFPSPEAQIDLVFELAVKGWRLHPVIKHGKKAILIGWQEKASCIKGAIQLWAVQHPDCNWAVACGAESDVVVLDVDNKHGHKGDDTLAALEAKHGNLPPTLVSHTGSGKGRQFFFQYPVGADYLKNISDGTIGDGLDVKVEGGYCVIPPSVTDIPYTFDDKETPLAPVPEWLLEMLKKAQTKLPASSATSSSQEKHQLIPKLSRHKYLLSVGGAMLRKGVNFPELLAALHAANQSHFVEARYVAR